MKKSFFLKILNIRYVALPSRPLPGFFKLCPWGQKWPCSRGHIGLYKINVLEYGHVAYQIERTEAYNNMLANILSLITPLTPRVGSKVFFLAHLSSWLMVSYCDHVVRHAGCVKCLALCVVNNCFKGYPPKLLPRFSPNLA